MNPKTKILKCMAEKTLFQLSNVLPSTPQPPSILQRTLKPEIQL